MSDIEKYFIRHQNEFDSYEPDSGHFERFELRLKEQQTILRSGQSRSTILKIAALILILISVSVFVFEFATREIRNRFSSEKSFSELPAEINEAVQYYNNQTNMHLGAIRKMAASNSEALSLSTAALKEIRNLDEATNDLKQTLSLNPGNEQILDAIIRNQKMKDSILNNILKQLSQSKN
jgi:hypothetical protein